jgi:hypothetical protein
MLVTEYKSGVDTKVLLRSLNITNLGYKRDFIIVPPPPPLFVPPPPPPPPPPPFITGWPKGKGKIRSGFGLGWFKGLKVHKIQDINKLIGR